MHGKKDLERLFAIAGRAEAARRRAAELRCAKRRKEVERLERLRHQAEANAPKAATRVWSWLGGEDAATLRALLLASGLDTVALLGWVTANARQLPSATYGAWRVSLTSEPGAVWVHRIGSPHGGRSRAVRSPAALIDLVPDEIIVALDRELSSGKYVRNVRSDLREHKRGGV